MTFVHDFCDRWLPLRMSRPPARILAVLVLPLAAGCGYTTGSTLDERYRTVHVAPFRNESAQFDLQAPLSNAVTRKFLNDTRLRVTGPEAADLMVEGTILEYHLRALTLAPDSDEVSQFYMGGIARVSVKDTRTGSVLWEDARMTGENSFASSVAGASTDRLRGNAETFLTPVRSFQTVEENRAAAEALESLAASIFYRTVEPW